MRRDYAKQDYLMTDKQLRVYRLIMKQPYITYRGIAKEIGVSEGTVQVIVRAIAKKGYISEHKKTVWIVLKNEDGKIFAN